MSREVYKNISLPRTNKFGRFNVKRVFSDKTIPRGLFIIHIGGQIWSMGKVSKKNHRVIYAPDGKEYHLYDNEALKFNFIDSIRIDKSLFKIHVLTNILDKVSNWCFDLNKKPNTGDLVKVIYNNGTVKNIVFSGEFERIIKQKYYGREYRYDYMYMSPVGYRFNTKVI
jgi:hypothetical protein